MPRSNYSIDKPRDQQGRFTKIERQARAPSPEDLVPVRRAANALRPIHTLPYELISHIALYSIHTRSELVRRPLRHMLRLTHIDSLWRDIVSSNPRLWEFVDNTETRLFLNLVPTFPSLKLQIRSTATGPALMEFLTIMSQQERLWKTLELGPESFLTAAMVPLLSVKAGDLTAVRVACHGHEADRYQLEAPNLRHIDVRGIAVEWSGRNGLLSLRIEDLQHVAPSIQQFTSILASSKDLRVLHIKNVKLIGMEDRAFVKSMANISLPHLVACRLISLGENVNRFIGTKIEAPLCRILQLDLESSSGVTAMDMVKGPASPLAVLTRGPMSCSAATIRVHYVAGTVTVHVISPHRVPDILWTVTKPYPYINFTFDLPWHVKEWASLTKYLSLPVESDPDSESFWGGRIAFHPSQTQDASAEDPFLEAHLDFWSSTREIEFKSGFRSIGAALQQLASVRMDAKERWHLWSCPRLTTLIFDCEVKDESEAADIVEGTLQVLQARNIEASLGEEDGGPARLESIYGPQVLITHLRNHFHQYGYDYGIILGASLPS